MALGSIVINGAAQQWVEADEQPLLIACSPLNPVFDGPSMSAAAEGNIMIEIHDSTVERVERNENGLLVVLSACVHRSKGVPGVSSGSVWSQTVHLQVQGGATESVKTPIWVVDGHVDLLGEIHDNVIPWPLSHQGPVRIELSGSEGEHIVLSGHGLTVTMLDDAKYLQEFSKEQAL